MQPWLVQTLIAVAVIFILPAFGWFGLPMLRWAGFAELRMRRDMRKEDRFIPWLEVAEKLSDGQGELECRRKGGSAGWFWYWPKGYGQPPAFLTDCPLRYMKLDRLSDDFPNAHVRQTRPF